MSRPNGSTEMAACILVWCAEHGISTDSDYVVTWLDEYWSRRFATLDAEAAVAQGVVGDDDEPGSPAWLDKHAGQVHLRPRLVVCSAEARCGDHDCPVCGAH